MADMNGNKRPRTTGSKSSESDWTCPKCQNVNFAFRDTCNMRKCGTAKPEGALMPAPVQQQQAPPMQGYGAQPPVYEQQGVQYVNSSVQPSYGGYAAVPQGYAQPQSQMLVNPYPPQAVPQYAQPQMQQPPPQYIQTQPMMQPQPMGVPQYGAPMDPYQAAPPYMGGGGGGMMNMPQQDARKRRSGPDAEGDWNCPKCGNTNFGFRTVCNMRKCGEAKPAPPPVYPQPVRGGGGQGGPGTSAPEGSWTCKACGNVNYPFRTHCNRRNCGVEKGASGPAAAAKGAAPASAAAS